MKELLRDAVAIMETGWARSPQDMSASDREVVTQIQSVIDTPEPYDQQALELCAVCGWKALIPGDCCLNCTRPTPYQEQVDELTDDEIKAIVEKCADDQWPDVGYVGWSVVDTEFYARLIKAVLAAQKGKT